MGEIEKLKSNLKVKKTKKLPGGGSKTTLVDNNQNEVSFVESAGRLYFVGVSEPFIALNGKKALTIIKDKYKMENNANSTKQR